MVGGMQATATNEVMAQDGNAYASASLSVTRGCANCAFGKGLSGLLKMSITSLLKRKADRMNRATSKPFAAPVIGKNRFLSADPEGRGNR